MTTSKTNADQVSVHVYSENDFSRKIEILEGTLAKIRGQDLEETSEERRQRITATLPFEIFCRTIQDALGSEIKMEDLKGPYRKLTTNPDAKIDWAEFFGYFQSDGEHQEFQWIEDVTIFSINKKSYVGDAAGSMRKRDCIQGLKVVPQIDSLLSISQKGTVIVWSPGLRVMNMLDLRESTWSTGIDFMDGFKRIITSTERSLHLIDHRAKGDNQQIFSIKPLTESPRCLCWVPLSKHVLEDCVVYGDDQGRLNLLTITTRDLTPVQKSNQAKGVQNIEVEPQHLSVPIKRRQVHSDWVMQVKYWPELKCLASCSPCPKKSFYLAPLERIWKSEKSVKTISIPKGVNCFEYCIRANVIVTAGVDKIIRVWHPHIWTRPTGKLSGHLFSICAMVCNQVDQHIISLSTARVIRVWDIQTMACLQVFSDADERPGEKRIYAMEFDQKFNRLITGSSVIETWPLTKAVQDVLQVPQSHDRPIVQLISNCILNQLITACTQPVVKVWDWESAQMLQSFIEPLGIGVEVSALAVNQMGYRLAVGGVDGGIVIIDLSAGQEIRKKSGDVNEDEIGIIGLTYCFVNDKECLVAVGWTDRVKVMLEKSENDRNFPIVMELQCHEWRPREISVSLTQTSKEIKHSISRESEPPPSAPPSASASELNPYSVLPEIASDQPAEVNHSEHLVVSTKASFSQPESSTHGYFQSWNFTCFDFLQPNYLALGCSNGDILFWKLMDSKITEKIQLSELDELDIPETEEELKIHSIRFLYKNSTEADRRVPSKMEELENVNNEEDMENKPSVEVEIKYQDNLVSAAMIETAKRPSHTGQKSHTGIKETSKSPHDEVMMPRDDDNYSDYSFELIYLASAHGDGRIRVWDLNGHLLLTVSPDQQVAQIYTSMVFEEEKQLLIVGSKIGYNVTLNCSHLFASSLDEIRARNKKKKIEFIQAIVQWRAHLSTVNSLICMNGFVTSASADASIRLYLPENAYYLGYFGQIRPFKFPKLNTLDLSIAATNTPYDIVERPVMSKIANKETVQKMQATKNTEFPLIFQENRWDAFNRTRFFKEKEDNLALMRETTKENVTLNLNKKYFKAITKPKVDRSRLEVVQNNYSPRDFSVFASLPVYRVRTPDKLLPPEGIEFFDLSAGLGHKKMLKKDVQSKRDNVSQKLADI